LQEEPPLDVAAIGELVARVEVPGAVRTDAVDLIS
jgi:hypothetical protein